MFSKPVYTVEEVADILGCKVVTVRRYCKRGLLKRVVGSRLIRITKDALIDFLENRFSSP